ncbi:MAG: hypothetical protein RL521_1000 [Bacteroidota bacterium]|jgi:hypothetical protein
MSIIYRVAQILSIIFHPLWMPLLIYAIVRWMDPYFIAPTHADSFVLALLIINIIAPALSILVMIKYGMVSGIELRERKERWGPYLLVILYYCISYALLRWQGPILPKEVFSFVFAVIVSLVFSLIINMFWKISVHMLGQGGVFGSLLALKYVHMADVTMIALCTILMASLTAYSRVKLDAHTHAQTYAGFTLGTAINWIIISNHWMI